MKRIVPIWLSKSEWNIAAVKMQKPAKNNAVICVLHPISKAIAAKISKAITTGNKISGTLKPSIHFAVLSNARTLLMPEPKNIVANKIRPKREPKFINELYIPRSISSYG